MGIEEFIEVAAYGVWTAMMVAAPVLILGLIAGLAVSLFQAATQINDSALAFIPKILATVVSLYIFGPWMMSQLSSFAHFSLGQIQYITM
jgi:flagellar biosynthetic protein FliQ